MSRLLTKKRAAWAAQFKRKGVAGSPVGPNAGVADWYMKELARLTDAMHETALREIEKLFRAEGGHLGYSEDAGISSQARIAMNGLRRVFARLFARKADELAGDMIAKASRANAAGVKASLKELSGGLTVKTDFISGKLAETLKAAGTKKEDLPALTPDGKKAVEDSDILRAAKAVSNVMYRSGEQRAFAAKMADALENYARLGGDVGALDNKFTALDSGNLRILMPKALAFDGLPGALHEATLELKASVPAGKDAESRRDALRLAALYENGYWIFDGADGVSFVDAGTGLPVARRSIAELKTSTSSMYEEFD